MGPQIPGQRGVDVFRVIFGQSQRKVSQAGHLVGFPSREQPFWGGPEGTILGGALERGHLGQCKRGTLKWVSDWGTWDGSWGSLLRVIWGHSVPR